MSDFKESDGNGEIISQSFRGMVWGLSVALGCKPITKNPSSIKIFRLALRLIRC